MRTDVNYHTLRAIVDDIQLQSNRSPAFAVFNKEKIKRFYQQNGLRIKTLDTRFNELVKEYVVHEGDTPKTQDGENGRKEYVFESEERKKEYMDKYNEFMELTFTLEV